MGSCCGGSSKPRAARPVIGYEVITMSGEKKGPYLTRTEANIELQAAGGGVIKPIYGTTN